jgi:ferrous iron transport protein B
MKLTIALAGNPNSGKTTLFNELTGSTQYVGNWPGVTVEKKEGSLLSNRAMTIVDLPGIYSLSPYTLEEVVTRDYLLSGAPNVIIDVIDASNLERNLYLATQLLELGIPMVLALNMTDIVEKRGDQIDLAQLERILGCPVIAISALRKRSLDQLIDQAIKAAESSIHQRPSYFLPSFAAQLLDIEQSWVPIQELKAPKYWYVIKLLEKDSRIQLQLTPLEERDFQKRIHTLENDYKDDSESIVISERYRFISQVIEQILVRKLQGDSTPSDRIDRIVTNRYLALPIFALVMFLVYFISVTTIGGMATDWVNDVLFGEILYGNISAFLINNGATEWVQSLVLDGIIGGIGAVLGFLPQMIVLFLFLGILEDIGYMARVAFILDRIFRRFGLSGKSFIPMLIGTGCSVPGIMAARTIDQQRDRRMTIITTPFIPCSAKLPIIALIAGALFPNSSLIAPSAYFVGIGAVIVSGIILKKTKTFAGEAAPFVMELPSYHIPNGRNLLRHVYVRALSFVKKAGTIIFLASVTIWFLSSFNYSLNWVEPSSSMLASIGNVIAPIFSPLGWGQWQAAVASITGLVAKESIVSTFGILYGVESVTENGMEVWENVRAAFTPLAGYSFLTFNLLCAPCFASIGATKREMGSAKWTWFTVLYQTIFAYLISMIIYQLGLLIGTGIMTVWTLISIMMILFFLYLIFRKDPQRSKRPE